MTSLLGGTTAVVMPGVKIGKPVGLPMSPLAYAKLIRAVVDTHVHLPDMFELTFNDVDGKAVQDAGLTIGATVEVMGQKATDHTSTSLIKGEVTSIEAICTEGQILSVVRGYERAHRLQRAKRTETYLNSKDSDIAKKVADRAGLAIGKIDATKTTHEHIAQVAQTDWEFLTQRAREIGYETGVVKGEFFFRVASGRSAGGLGGAAGAAAGAAASAAGFGGGLTFKDNLLSFFPRVSAANLTPDVEVRVWDPKSAKAVVGKASAATGTATLSGQDPKALANKFTDGVIPTLAPPPMPSLPGMPELSFGAMPGDNSYVVVDRPLAYGSNTSGAADEAAAGIADHVASTFAEAEGDALGDPAIQAGESVDIKGVPKMFVGKWTVTNARHIFDPEEGGYHTRFWVSGRSDRSLLSLASGGSGRDDHSRFEGMVCGVVTSVKDPDKKGKVKFALPWLSPNYESDWARVVQLTAGARTGAMFLPEVGDEVLIGFEMGDARRPYVLGGLINDNTKFEPMATAVGSDGVVTGRGLASPSGNKLVFLDELPPGPPGQAPASKSQISLGTKNDSLGLVIDQAAGTVTLTCKPAPPGSSATKGKVLIDCSGAGGIEIKGGADGIKITSMGMLELSGSQGVKIDGGPQVDVKGAHINLN